MEGKCFTKDTKLYMILQNLRHFDALEILLGMIWLQLIWLITGQTKSTWKKEKECAQNSALMPLQGTEMVFNPFSMDLFISSAR